MRNRNHNLFIMIDTPLSRQFYSADDSYLAEANSTIEQFSTPLKRLPNPLVNEVRNEIHILAQQPVSEPLPSGEPHVFSRTQHYRFFDSKLPLEPISDVALGVKAAKPQDLLFSQKSSKADDAVYYRPLSTAGTILLKDFLPPPLPQATRNPIIISEPVSRVDLYEELDDDNLHTPAPSGEWTSPVVREALRRQVNKERQFRHFWRCILRLFAFHLALLLAAYVYKLYNVVYFDANALYRNTLWSRLQRSSVVQELYERAQVALTYVHHFQWIFVAQIVVSLVQLVRPQDQCKDLPLTNKQRRLIGLAELANVDDGDDAVALLVSKQRVYETALAEPLQVPKYAKSQLSGLVRRTVPKQTEATVDLGDILPQRRFVGKGVEQEDIATRFGQRFNL